MIILLPNNNNNNNNNNNMKFDHYLTCRLPPQVKRKCRISPNKEILFFPISGWSNDGLILSDLLSSFGWPHHLLPPLLLFVMSFGGAGEGREREKMLYGGWPLRERGGKRERSSSRSRRLFFGDMWRNDGDDAPEGKIVVKIVGFYLIFQVNQSNGVWGLSIRRVGHEDQGVYECQVVRILLISVLEVINVLKNFIFPTDQQRGQEQRGGQPQGHGWVATLLRAIWLLW